MVLGRKVLELDFLKRTNRILRMRTQARREVRSERIEAICMMSVLDGDDLIEFKLGRWLKNVS